MSDTILINLGVDFGTRFTKVCAHSEGVGTIACDFSGQGIGAALSPSVVTIARDGSLGTPLPGQEFDHEEAIAYLKMAIAEPSQLYLGSNLRGYVRDEVGLSEALSAYFCSDVIRRAKSWVQSTWDRNIGGRQILWSANIGIPVQYCDSPIVDTYERVFATAWHWSEQTPEKVIFGKVVDNYRQACDQVEIDKCDCFAYPEIAAAVMAFATSRSAEEGVYVYFDIGAGTLDGSVFALRRPEGMMEVNFFSGEVAGLGVEWLAPKLLRVRNQEYKKVFSLERARDIILSSQSDSLTGDLAPLSSEVKGMVGSVIGKGKRKDPSNWREEAAKKHRPSLTLRRSTSDVGMEPLPVFIGGGGVKSGFYQSAIREAYYSQKLQHFGIPPLDLREVPAPRNLDLLSISPQDYHRFLISLGLSVPFGQGPEFRLPSCFEDAEIKKPPQSEIPAYEDYKALFD